MVIGSVLMPGPVRNKAITSSSKESTRLRNALASSDGLANGSVTRKKVFTGDAPRMIEASSTDRSIRENPASMVRTT
ncbi:hypothetical protein D3C79_1023950 [compost metagenome]